MPIRNPYAGVLKVEEIPVVCPGCGYQDNLYALNRDIRHALVTATLLNDFQKEVAVLERMEHMLSRFPEAQQFFSIDAEPRHYRRWLKAKPDDSELQRALNADPELTEVLRCSSFLLPGRLAYCRDRVEQVTQDLAQETSAIKCPQCQGDLLRLEPMFYEGVGLLCSIVA